MNKWFLSSDGSGNLSLTIKSLLLGIVPVVVVIARMHGFEIVENDLVQILENVFAFATLVGVTYGLCRKVYFAFKK